MRPQSICIGKEYHFPHIHNIALSICRSGIQGRRELPCHSSIIIRLIFTASKSPSRPGSLSKKRTSDAVYIAQPPSSGSRILLTSIQIRSRRKRKSRKRMASGGQMRNVASLLLLLNFCMYVIVVCIAGWATNIAIDRGFIIGPGFDLPAHFSPIYFPMGNAATGFFVTFALIAGSVGLASAIAGINHLRAWHIDSLPSAASAAAIAWTLTLLAMGFACKEIQLHLRNAKLRTMEAFLIILSATQLIYIIAIHAATTRRV